MTSYLDNALELHAMGLSLMPVLRKRKRPAVKWKPYMTQRADEEQIRHWFATGHYNVGIICGAVSGIVVVDADSAKAIGAMEAAIEFEHVGQPMFATDSGRTDGGRHYYYRHPGRRVRSKPQGKLKLGGRTVKELELKGDGGYVVAPGSIHHTGRIYARRGEWVMDDSADVFDPSWFDLKLIDRPEYAVQRGSGVKVCSQHLADYLDRRVGTRKGDRNNSLYLAACDCQAGGWSMEEALDALTPVAMENGIDGGEAAVRQTVESGYAEPRSISRLPDDEDIEEVEVFLTPDMLGD